MGPSALCGMNHLLVVPMLLLGVVSLNHRLEFGLGRIDDSDDANATIGDLTYTTALTYTRTTTT